jgi:hypothetical protein
LQARQLFLPAGISWIEASSTGTFMSEVEWDAAAYRERALAAQKKAAEAPTPGLSALWQELAERYFELADQVEPEALLRFPHKAHKPANGGRVLL